MECPDVSHADLVPLDATPKPAAVSTRRRYLVRCCLGLALVAFGLVALFVVNGTLLGHGESPLTQTTSVPAAEAWAVDQPETFTIMCWNIARAFAWRGGLEFDSREAVRRRVLEISQVIDREHPDLVFLSETLLECGPCPVNQVQAIAEAAQMHSWTFGENFNFGLPFYRGIGGNAILSRRPLEPVANPALAGRKPFYMTRNNRRALWCAALIQGERVLLAAIHTDSFKPRNNLEQTRQLIAFASDQPSILAGDFNSNPGEPSMEELRASGRWTGIPNGPATYPADAPEQRIDFILVPSAWELVDERVIDTRVSDHRPVVSTYRVQWQR